METYKKNNIPNLIVFEPQKTPFQKLSSAVESVGLDHAILINKALGNSCKTVEMTCNDDGLCSSILKPKVKAGNSIPILNLTERKLLRW